MNTVYEKNLEALGKRYDEIKQAVIWAGTGSYRHNPCDVHAELYDTGSGTALIAARGEETVYQLDSLYDRQTTLQIWEEQFGLKRQDYMAKYIFFGIGNGMLVRRILERCDETIRVLVYEPSILFFKELVGLCDYSDLFLDERVEWIVENIPYFFKEHLYHFADYRDLEKLFYQPYPNYRNLFTQEQQDTRFEVQMFHNAVWATQDVMARYGTWYFLNLTRNMADLVRTKSLLDMYKKMPKDLPFIMVSSGPSLDKNIEYLKGLKGKAFMMAADSAVRVLLKHDIIPDMFVSIDAVKNQNHFLDPRVADIPFLTEATSNYNTLLKVRAPKFFFNDMNPHVNQFLTEHEILLPYFTSGGSVANTGYALATSMGFHTIILVGQDLAYTDNKTHSAESVRGEWKVDVSGFVTQEVEGYYGDKVKTSTEFQLYRRWFEDQIPMYPDSHTINATEGGAMIHGAENMPLSEAVAKYCTKEYDVDGIIASIEDAFDGDTKRELIAYLQKAPEELREIDHQVKNSIRDYEKILEIAYSRKLKQGELKRLLARTKEVSELVEKAPVMYYIQNEMQQTTHEYLSKVYEAKESVIEELIDTATLGRDYLKVVTETIQKCLPDMELYMGKLSEILP
ncbi:MAG: DUF115 domain-containing protein [bacterium]|nr:DUF115 domain-containing protein [bacterium]